MMLEPRPYRIICRDGYTRDIPGDTDPLERLRRDDECACGPHRIEPEPTGHPEFEALTLGPNDHLVLVAQHLTPEQTDRIKHTIPEALRGRILVVAEMDAYVIPEALGE